MKFELFLHLFHHFPESDQVAETNKLLRQIHERQERILERVDNIFSEVGKVANAIDNLVDQVAKQKTVVDSAVTLLNNLTALLQNAVNTGDMDKVQQVIDDIKSQDDTLAKAVEQNTPAAP